MIRFEELIQREAREISLLHENIHRTFQNRSNDRDTWSKACEKFHSHVSAMDIYIDQIYDNSKISDRELLEFGLRFLEIDPIFFRSGYIKEEILTKIKRSALNKSQLDRLKSVLLDSIEKRGSKEFKYYCRLAGFIADEHFINQLKTTESFLKGKRKYRVKRMLQTIIDSGAHNKASKIADGAAAA